MAAWSLWLRFYLLGFSTISVQFFLFPMLFFVSESLSQTHFHSGGGGSLSFPLFSVCIFELNWIPQLCQNGGVTHSLMHPCFQRLCIYMSSMLDTTPDARHGRMTSILFNQYIFIECLLWANSGEQKPKIPNRNSTWALLSCDKDCHRPIETLSICFPSIYII